MSVRNLLIFGLLIGTLATGCTEVGNGSCPGDMNGQYFNLAIYNFSDGIHEVLVNDRPVGQLGAYKGRDGDGNSVPAVIDLGEFPVCDGWVVDAQSEEANLGERFCSKAPFLECVTADQDFCSEGFAICVDVTEDGCIPADGQPVNYFPPPPTAICPCSIGPGEAWEYCK